MNSPIPRPKILKYTGGTVPATFNSKNTESIFAPALRAFHKYASRVFGSVNNFSDELILIHES